MKKISRDDLIGYSVISLLIIVIIGTVIFLFSTNERVYYDWSSISTLYLLAPIVFPLTIAALVIGLVSDQNAITVVSIILLIFEILVLTVVFIVTVILGIDWEGIIIATVLVIGLLGFLNGERVIGIVVIFFD
jgi:lysylphosphatidylglycerol synthetase-like protein (DUF2156 family)